MRLRDARDKIDALEQSCDVELLRLGKFNAWPLVRLSIWNLLVSPEDPLTLRKFATIRELPISMILNFGIDLALNKLPNMFKANSYGWATDSDVLLIGRPSHSQYVTGYERPFDRVLDPIQFALKSQLRVTSVFLGITTPRNVGRRRLRLVFGGNASPVTGITESGLSKLLADQQIDEDRILAELDEASRNFWRGYHSFCKLLKQARRLQAVFVSVWYSAEMMGIIAAARENNLTVVDVQHGADDSNAMGSWKIDVGPFAGYEMVPQIFWRWQESKCCLQVCNEDKKNVGHRSVVGGYPWISYWQFLQSQISERSVTGETLITTDRQVLFSVRNPFGESKERIPDFLLEFLRLPHPDVTVVIRLHPNDRFGWRKVRQKLTGTFRTRFRIANPEEDLYRALSESTHLVTAFSAVCLEALTLGIPTLLFGEDAKVNYQELIESDRVKWTSGSAGDLEEFVYRDGDQVPSPAIPSSLKLTVNTVSDILSAGHISRAQRNTTRLKHG